MMNVAIFGKNFESHFDSAIQSLVDELLECEAQIWVHETFVKFLSDRIELKSNVQSFKVHSDLPSDSILISIGGDGTLLETIHIIRDSGIPVLGINTGRLGFLSNVSSDSVKDAIRSLKKKDYTIDERSLIKVESNTQGFGDFPFALNEVTFHKKDTASMITVHAYMGNTFINTYWADGLIIATPTGSTAYSLSCGGPIVMPGGENFIFTPIAPHNLNVRPLIVPNHKVLSFRVEGRDSNFLLTLDSKSFTIDDKTEVVLSKSDFNYKLINLPGQHFFDTIRNKMMWGIDRRN